MQTQNEILRILFSKLVVCFFCEQVVLSMCHPENRRRACERAADLLERLVSCSGWGTRHYTNSSPPVDLLPPEDTWQMTEPLVFGISTGVEVVLPLSPSG